MSQTIVVIPCYNEARRLPVERFLGFVRRAPNVRLLFVNDGSTDATASVLRRMGQSAPQSIDLLELAQNRGKAEAVRQGCLAALARGGDYVGYWDADLATPLESLPDFLQEFEARPGLELVCGARVLMLGRSIHRDPIRHYLGRVFATAASWALGLAVYDTQCGAKLFRASPRMAEVFSQPFTTRWVFDVEILARLTAAGRAGALPPVEQVVCELPLKQWHDVPGSKVRPRDFPTALLELAAIRRRYFRSGPRPRQGMVASPAPAAEVPDPRLAA